MTKPKISVIMSVYNDEKYVSEAIESILNQTYGDFEFIIVDDASSDKSLSIIKGYDDPRIIVIENGENIGLTRSLNKALQSARGEYIARQDADDYSLEERFEKQIDYLDKYPEVVLLGTSYYTIDEYGNNLGKRLRLKKPTFEDMLRVNAFTHGSVIFKKEPICELGGYNRLFKYRQDYYLWLEVIKHHYQVMNLTEPFYASRFHMESLGFKKTGETELYTILAKKLARNELDENIIGKIEKEGINHLYSVLTDEEQSKLQESINKESELIQFIRGTPNSSKEKYSMSNPLYYMQLMERNGFLTPQVKRFIIKTHYTISNVRTQIRNL